MPQRSLDLDLDLELHPQTARQRQGRESLAALSEPEQRAAVLARHRAEWADHLDLWWDAHHTRNLELARLAKLQAETLRIRQADERRAWSLDADADPTVTLDPAQNLARIHELLRALNLGPAH